MSSISNLQQLEEVLKRLLVHDTKSIKEAESILRNFTSSPQCILPLFFLIQKSSQVVTGVRHMSTILIKHKIDDYWSHLDEKSQAVFKTGVLECIVTEPQALVRSSIMRVIGSVAKMEIPNGKWQDLSKFVWQLVNSQSEKHRETGLMLTATLFDSVGGELIGNIKGFLGVFQKSLEDKSVGVQKAVIKAIGSMCLSLDSDEEVSLFLKLIPSLLKVMNQFIQQDEDEAVTDCFEVFEELMCMKNPEFQKQIPALVKVMLQLAGNTKTSLPMRLQAAEIVTWAVAHESKRIISSGLVEHVLKLTFQLLCEKEEDPEDEQTAHKSGSCLLDNVAVGITSEFIFKPVITYAVKLCGSNDVTERKAGITAIGVMAEGCHEHMRESLESLLPVLMKGLTDQQRSVREVSLLAVHAFVEYTQPEILEYYQKIIPICIDMLGDPSENIKAHAVFTLDAFCSNLGEKIGPYVEKLVKVALHLLTNGNPSLRVQEIAVSVLASVAMASGLAFLPYSQTVLKLMGQIMQNKNQDVLSLRAHATECAGNIAFAIGSKNFPVKQFLEMAIDGLKLESPDLRDYTYAFLTNIAHVLGEEFAGVLPYIMNHLLSSINAIDHEYKKESGESLVANVISTNEESDNSDSEDDETHFIVNSSIVEEKSSATSTVGIIAEACRDKFQPYHKKMYEAISLNLTHFHFDVRRETVTTLKYLLGKDDIPELIGTYSTLMTEEEDKEVVARMCESVSYVCKKFGPVFNKELLAKICEALIALLTHDAECNDGEAQGKDHDMVLIDSVSDCIDDLAKAYGPNFEPFYRPIYKVLMDYAKNSKSEGDVMMSVGTMSNVGGYMKHALIPYIDSMLPLMLASLKNSSVHVRRNAVYALGVMCVSAPQEMSAYIMQILQLVAPILREHEKFNPFLVDNACATVCRVLVTYETTLTVIDQVLSGLLDALPLRVDVKENETVFGCLLTLLKHGNTAAAKNMGRIFELFAFVLGTELITPEIQESIISVCRDIYAKYPQQVESVTKGMKEKDNFFAHIKN